MEEGPMDRARKALSPQEGESEEAVDALAVRQHRPGRDESFYEGFINRGIRIDHIVPGALTCSFTVPSRLTGRDGNLSAGAIANLVDEVGGAATRSDGCHIKVSVDMNISYLSTAKVNDELEITARVLGHKGGYSGTIVLLKNKTTGEILAEGRHSLFGNLLSKI